MRQGAAAQGVHRDRFRPVARKPRCHLRARTDRRRSPVRVVPAPLVRLRGLLAPGAVSAARAHALRDLRRRRGQAPTRRTPRLSKISVGANTAAPVSAATAPMSLGVIASRASAAFSSSMRRSPEPVWPGLERFGRGIRPPPRRRLHWWRVARMATLGRPTGCRGRRGRLMRLDMVLPSADIEGTVLDAEVGVADDGGSGEQAGRAAGDQAAAL